MEAPTWEQRLRRVRQALELDPENVDALLMLAEAAELKSEERIATLQDIVAAGAKWRGRGLYSRKHHGLFTRCFGNAKATRLPPAGRPDFAPPAEITTNWRPSAM